jgi:hypothetical protein
MTKQITIKLNHDHFRPLLEELKLFAGTGITESDSDMVGKALFFCHQSVIQRIPQRNHKTHFEILTDNIGISKSDAILYFLNNYSDFKKKGLKGLKK